MQKLQNPGGIVSWFLDTEAEYLLSTTPGWVVLETVADDAVVEGARGEKAHDPKQVVPVTPAPAPVIAAPVADEAVVKDAIVETPKKPKK